MKLLSFIAHDDIVAPIYCNKVVENVLPFEHGRVTIVKGDTFNAKVVDGRTVLTIKPGAGASFHAPFKVPYASKVREAIQGLRAAACAAVYQAQANGETVCLS